jgi:hypothetical protein
MGKSLEGRQGDGGERYLRKTRGEQESETEDSREERNGGKLDGEEDGMG